MAPRLLAAFGTDRGRWQTAVEIQLLSGIAPVTSKAAKAGGYTRAWGVLGSCAKASMNADHSSKWGTWATPYYRKQRARGNNNQPLCALGYRCFASSSAAGRSVTIQRKPLPRLPGAPPLLPGGRHCQANGRAAPRNPAAPTSSCGNPVSNLCVWSFTST